MSLTTNTSITNETACTVKSTSRFNSILSHEKEFDNHANVAIPLD
jgi:hypothetical protein